MATPQVISVQATQQPMIIQQVPAQQPATTYNINVRATKTLGTISTVIAVLLLALGIAQAVLAAVEPMFSAASGIWCGLFILVAGVLGLNSAKRPQNGCLIGCTMAFNIVVMVASSFAYGTTGVGIALWSIKKAEHHYRSIPEPVYDGYYDQHRVYVDPDDGSRALAGIAVNSIVMFLLCIEWVVALIAAIFFCTGCCCRPRGGMIIQQAQPMYMTGGVQSSYGQPMVAYGQPIQYGQAMGQPMVGQYYGQQAAPPGYAAQQGGAPSANPIAQDAATGNANMHAQQFAAGENTTNPAYGSEQKEVPPPAYNE